MPLPYDETLNLDNGDSIQVQRETQASEVVVRLTEAGGNICDTEIEEVDRVRLIDMLTSATS